MVTITIRTDKISHVVSPVLEIRGTLKLILDPLFAQNWSPGTHPSACGWFSSSFGYIWTICAPE